MFESLSLLMRKLLLDVALALYLLQHGGECLICWIVCGGLLERVYCSYEIRDQPSNCFQAFVRETGSRLYVLLLNLDVCRKSLLLKVASALLVNLYGLIEQKTL